MSRKSSSVSKGVSDILDRTMAGSHPVFNPKKGKEQVEIDVQVMHALNWYANMANDAKERAWFIAYASQTGLLTKQECQKSKEIDAGVFVRAGRYAHMMTNGFPIESWTKDTIEKCISRLRKKFSDKKVVIEEKKNAPSIQDRMDEKAYEISNFVTTQIDSFLETLAAGKIKKSDDESFFSMTSYLNSNEIKSPIASRVLKKLELDIQEWRDAEKNNEGYDYLTDSEIKRMVRFVGWIEEALKLKIAEKTTAKKTRKKKQKTPQELTKKVKFLARTDLYGGIDSITPDKILGSEKVIIYNIKTREYSIYESLDKLGLSFKGTTIQNFDEKKSVSKKIRETHIKSLLDTTQKQGIRATKNAFDSIKAKQFLPNGRTNENSIIMKVYK